MSQFGTLRRSVCWVGLLAVVSFASTGPGAVRPWVEPGAVPDAERTVGTILAATIGPGMQAGADHIVGQQCGDGGWGWPHDDCSVTYHNITAPIALGVMCAYDFIADGDHLASAVDAGDFDLTSQYTNGEARFGSATPYFLWQLTLLTADAAYRDFAEVEFFDALSAGTYGPSDLDTAGWIATVQAARAGTWINLLPWEFQTLIPTATAIGNTGQDQDFLQALLDGLNTLDNTDPDNVYSDLIGLAGGVRGLALSGTTTFTAISSPKHADIDGIDNLHALADTLAGHQNADGSWYWHSDLPTPGEGDKDTQTTAYAVLALIAADPLVASDYTAAITAGRTFLLNMQQTDGGFLSWPGGSENTEVEGEALTVLCGAVGACCQFGVACTEVPEAECIVAGGNFQGEGTSCDCFSGACCTGTCTFEADTMVCRAAAGVCDAAEYCTGSDANCPADVLLTDVCRPSTGPCDPAEMCNGSNPACPADVRITACINGDGCCPPGCNANNDDDCSAVCGNNIKEPGEECDGTDAAACPGECEGDCTCPVTAIPTLSQWGMMIMGLVLLIGARVYFRRRSAARTAG